MNLRKKIEAEIRVEMAWLRRATNEILGGKELASELKKYIALAVMPWRNSGVRMNMQEYRKAVQLRKILFGSRQKKKLPGWVFEFSGEKIQLIDRRIGERLRADLPKKLLANVSGFSSLAEPT